MLDYVNLFIFAAMKSCLYVLIMSLLLVGCVIDSQEETPSTEESSIIRVGDQLPAFSVEVVDGDSMRTFSSQQLTGPTVIVFFHTACSDCSRELPELNDYYLRHRNDPGFQMVAIAREETRESISAFWQQQGMAIPYSPQSDRSIYSLFATLYIPRVYFCKATGEVTWIGIENFDLPQ